jgi:myo-inositol-1(or 4)-monophosphatase
LVTEADYAAQETIRNYLKKKYPDHAFLGEEDDGFAKILDTEGFCWIVDPLDGTKNFVHQLRSFSVSVALAYQGKIVAGTVLDPVLEESYSAALGHGANLNGEPIQTSRCADIKKSLMVCSFSNHVRPDHPEVQRFLQVMHQAGTVRRLGSAALNFCYVACGRLDAYWATSLNVWDVAAGLLILQEAGGCVSHIDGQPFDLRDPRFLASANSEFHQKLLPLMRV